MVYRLKPPWPRRGRGRATDTDGGVRGVYVRAHVRCWSCSNLSEGMGQAHIPACAILMGIFPRFSGSYFVY
eukprot:2736137-Prymnesium_polylepis.1